MATMKPILRRVELNSIVVLLAGVLCGIGIMTAVSLVHPLKERAAAPVYIVGAPTNPQNVTDGRLGGILNSDTANDAAVRDELGPSAAAGTLSRSVSTNFVLPGDVDEGTLQGSIAQLTAPVVGGRLGGLGSADTPNDAAIKQAVATSIQDVQNGDTVTRYGELAGQRDVNATDQSSQADFYPSFQSGHAW